MVVGDFVEMEILDHCLGTKELAGCLVRGVVAELTKTKVTLCFWETDLDGDANNENMTIILGAVSKWRKVKKWSDWYEEKTSFVNQ